MKYINLWNNRYKFLPTHKAIIALEIACDLEYMPWFRHHCKSYLLAKEARGRQCHMRGPWRVPRHPKSVVVAEAGPSSTPTTTSCNKLLCFYIDAKFYFWTTTSVPNVLHTNAIDVQATTILTKMYRPSRIKSPIVLLSVYETQYGSTHTLMVSETPPGSLFYQDEPSLQPLFLNEGYKMQQRSTPQSTTNEREKDERPRPSPVLEVRCNDEDEEADIHLE
ncbi:hypothetical protein J1N35_033832 [Gossypium stocksii]|uniref:Uncharacterized protein n=1 Tax=Gossypium stocksii TaxID=47602 RepID=A0A9D3UQY4_9ROSI|nr:hypothetical protein J1N35_033832 [Gossypium stocksii]